MKRIIIFALALLLAVSICACESDEIAGKVSEFAESLQEELREASGVASSGISSKAPVCKAEGRDLIITYECDPTSGITSDALIEINRNDGPAHYSRFQELAAFAGDDSVRLIIKYIDADGVEILSQTIDKEYDPSAGGIQLLNPDANMGDGTEPEPGVDAAEIQAEIEEFLDDNAERIGEEYSGLFDGADGPDCHVEDLNLVLEYRYTMDITRWEFFEIIEEAASGLEPLADELAAAVGSPAAGLIIRCFDNNGVSLLDYPIGGLNPPIFEMEAGE